MCIFSYCIKISKGILTYTNTCVEYYYMVLSQSMNIKNYFASVLYFFSLVPLCVGAEEEKETHTFHLDHTRTGADRVISEERFQEFEKIVVENGLGLSEKELIKLLMSKDRSKRNYTGTTGSFLDRKKVYQELSIEKIPDTDKYQVASREVMESAIDRLTFALSIINGLFLFFLFCFFYSSRKNERDVMKEVKADIGIILGLIAICGICSGFGIFIYGAALFLTMTGIWFLIIPCVIFSIRTFRRWKKPTQETPCSGLSD